MIANFSGMSIWWDSLRLTHWPQIFFFPLGGKKHQTLVILGMALQGFRKFPYGSFKGKHRREVHYSNCRVVESNFHVFHFSILIHTFRPKKICPAKNYQPSRLKSYPKVAPHKRAVGGCGFVRHLMWFFSNALHQALQLKRETISNFNLLSLFILSLCALGIHWDMFGIRFLESFKNFRITRYVP